jgi:hypothetical protein
MRALRLPFVVVLSVLLASRIGVAQDRAAQPSSGASPLSARLLPSGGDYIQYELSDPAYVAVFNLDVGGPSELLYPYAASDRPEPAGVRAAQLSYLVQGEEERAVVFAGVPSGGESCLFLVASRWPLHLEQYTTHPLALAHDLAGSVAVDPETRLAPILDPVRPPNPDDWTTDVLCGVSQVAGMALPRNYYAIPALLDQGSYLADGIYDQGYIGPLGMVPPMNPVTVSVCVIHAGDASRACRPPRLPTHEPPYRVRGGTPSVLAAGRPVLVRGRIGQNAPIHGEQPAVKGRDPERGTTVASTAGPGRASGEAQRATPAPRTSSGGQVQAPSSNGNSGGGQSQSASSGGSRSSGSTSSGGGNSGGSYSGSTNSGGGGYSGGASSVGGSYSGGGGGAGGVRSR